MMSIAVVTIPAKVTSNLVFTIFLSIIIDGSDRAVTAIIKARAVPIPTPYRTNASAVGSVPKISAYIGIPTIVASGTEYHYFIEDKFFSSDIGY